MNAADIKKILMDDSVVCPMFRGIFPSDQLPHRFDDGVYIINTSPSDVKDGHWVALVDREFFCSFGTNPDTYGLPKFSCYNMKCLQSIMSNVCGLYVLLYVKVRCRGFSLDDFLSCFTSNSSINDDIVRECATLINMFSLV